MASGEGGLLCGADRPDCAIAEVEARARAEALVFRLARQERDFWVTWPARVAALMAAQVAAEVEQQSGKPVLIDARTLQRIPDAHVRAQLEALADLRISLA